jgi:hypothetical protein
VYGSVEVLVLVYGSVEVLIHFCNICQKYLYT